MNMLIIKKDMCTKSRKHIPLTYSPKEKRLINIHRTLAALQCKAVFFRYGAAA